MSKIRAGGAVTLLLTTGAFLFWHCHAANRAILLSPPSAESAPVGAKFAMLSPELPSVPEATSKTREEKRFERADKDKDGKVTEEELLAPRHKAGPTLDADHNGMLSFNEWAAKTINKFEGADDDHNGALTAAEYAETAPNKPRHHPVRCT